ncbi:hypothetical protein CWIS_05465 [Cellulomonas sp. A375-1]|nr:hypothetical protein CWIS_05465 [Cellulomonas sp. A375-1]
MRAERLRPAHFCRCWTSREDRQPSGVALAEEDAWEGCVRGSPARQVRSVECANETAGAGIPALAADPATASAAAEASRALVQASRIPAEQA